MASFYCEAMRRETMERGIWWGLSLPTIGVWPEEEEEEEEGEGEEGEEEEGEEERHNMGDEEVTTLSASEAEYGTWMTILSPALDSCVDHTVDTVDTTQENLPAAHTSQSKGGS